MEYYWPDTKFHFCCVFPMSDETKSTDAVAADRVSLRKWNAVGVWSFKMEGVGTVA